MNEFQSIEKRARRAVIRISGPDAQKLLGDVLSGPVAAETGPASWWALLTPQGKILAEGLCSFAKDAFWLDVDRSVRESFLKRMALYKLRADVAFEDLGDSHAVGWSETGIADHFCARDSRGDTLGFRVIAPNADAAGWRDGTEFEKRRIDLAVMELGPDFEPDALFPHDIGMDLLGGVDFDKGCYVGQEVVSRMTHRGTARRRPVIVSGDAMMSGAHVMVGAREAGRLGAVVDGRGIAVLRLDRVDDPGSARVGGEPVSLVLPMWADYAFNDSGGGA